MAQSVLAKRLGVLRRNLYNLGGTCWGWFLKGLYNFGLPLSVLYGKQILKCFFDHVLILIIAYRPEQDRHGTDAVLLPDRQRAANGENGRTTSNVNKIKERGFNNIK